ncbi:MAG TPA: universal stress protein [Nocardioidaceae bacterium]|nr:universal stress protein [Nocardioidaceae bacterium]
MHHRHGRPVVVGVNGTPESDVALHWAVEEARRRQRPVHIVSAHSLSEPGGMEMPLTVPALPPPTREAHDVYERALDYARNRLDSDEVTGELISGGPIAALRQASETAELVVVGTRDRPVRHSVSCAVAAHASCPVVVARGPQEKSSSTIVVGLDGSDESEQAAAFAFEEAELRGAIVEAIHYWTPIGPDAGYREWVRQTGLDLRRQVTECVASARAKHPTVAATEQVLEGRPSDELAARSATAELVVVGSRGHGRFVGTLLGSVSQDLLSNAHCPVVVVKHQH